jgi:hypothetical protein
VNELDAEHERIMSPCVSRSEMGSADKQRSAVRPDELLISIPRAGVRIMILNTFKDNLIHIKISVAQWYDVSSTDKHMVLNTKCRKWLRKCF